MKQSASNTFFLLVALLVFSITAIILQNVQSKYRPVRSSMEEFQYLPSGKFLKGAALGFDEVLADLLYIKALGYVGGNDADSTNYLWLDQLIQVITTLEPNNEEPYEFAGIVLSSKVGTYKRGMKILQEGMENVPKSNKRYWYFPFFLAFDYMFYESDYKTAAEYLHQAASFPESPKYLPLLVSRLYANTDDPSVAIPFLEQMIKKTKNENRKKALQNRIKDIIVKQQVETLEKAVKEYEYRFGAVPRSLFELIVTGIVAELPKDPYGGGYYLLTGGRVISSSGEVDSMELHLPEIRDLDQGIQIKATPIK